MTPVPAVFDGYPVIFLYDRKTNRVKHALIVTVREILHFGVDEKDRFRKDYDLNLVYPNNQNSMWSRGVIDFLIDILDSKNQLTQITWRIESSDTLHTAYRKAYASGQSLNLVFKPGVTVPNTPNANNVEDLISSLEELSNPAAPAAPPTPSQQAPHRQRKTRESEVYIRHLMKGKDD